MVKLSYSIEAVNPDNSPTYFCIWADTIQNALNRALAILGKSNPGYTIYSVSLTENISPISILAENLSRETEVTK